MAQPNYITKVAIVGAGGNCGRFITEALLKTRKHIVTALTRADGQSTFPDGVVTETIDYEEPATLVQALRGQDALVITLSGHAPKDTELKLVGAAAEAGVAWILPNEWSPDTANEELVGDVFVFQSKVATRNAIEGLGRSAYIAISTGFWYEYSLAMPAAFGLDFAKRRATFFDEGKTKISVSTWPQVGRAVAALLSLPVERKGSADDMCLEHIKNKVIYINSFTVSQTDMLESACRVTGTIEADWTITKERSHERYATGLKEIKEGSRVGFAKMMYTRVFYPDGCGDFEHSKGTLNKVLSLTEEDIDSSTKNAIERSKSSSWVT